MSMRVLRSALLATALASTLVGTVVASPVALPKLAAAISARTPIRDLGRAPATYPVSIVVTLPYRNDRQLEALIQAQGNPDSAVYRRFLTPAEFAAAFGPTAQQETQVMLLLQRAGFRITDRSANRTTIEATVPAAVAERYFSTEIHLAAQVGQSIRYYNARPAIVPRELAQATFSVLGLSNIDVGKHDIRPVRIAPFAAHPIGQPLQGQNGMGPLAWAQGYDLPVQHGYDGQNIRVADLEESPPVPEGYIQTYRQAFNVQKPADAKTIVTKIGSGCSANCTSGNGAMVWPADTEYLAALAPGAQQYLYQLPEETISAWTDGFNRIVADNKADVATSFVAYGEEDPNDETFALTLDHIIRQGNALGITFVAQADFIANEGGALSSTPADSPHVLSVGSVSTLVVNEKGDYAGELAGRAQPDEDHVSLWFPTPPYQAGINGVDPNGRNVPDVSYATLASIAATKGVPNGPYTFPFFSPGFGWGGALYYGSSPIVAWVAEFDQMNAHRAGLVNTAVYALYKKRAYGPRNAAAFHNIGGMGFDESVGTGIGSIDGWNLATALRTKR
jgi:subtilase family serine protease